MRQKIKIAMINKKFSISGDKSGVSGKQWLLTFADLLSLILTFFVMLYAMSSIDGTEWEKVNHSLSQRLKPNPEQGYSDPAAELGIKRINVANAVSLDYLSSVIAEKIKDSEKLSNSFSSSYDGDKLVITLIDKDVFLKDENKFSENGSQIIALLGDILQSVGNQISVYGSVENKEIDTPEFSSNWELSLSRALVVSQALRIRGYAYKITAFGREGTEGVGEKDKSGEKIGSGARHIEIVVKSESAQP